MMCSRTVMLYIDNPDELSTSGELDVVSIRRVPNPVTQRVSGILRQRGHHFGQRLELAFAGDQGVEHRIGEQRKRETHAARVDI